MLTRRAGLRACLLGAILFAPSVAHGDSPQEILGFALGNSAPTPSQALGVFGLGGLAPAMIEAPSFVEAPTPHYVLKLDRNRTLTIWFDTNRSDRPIYWIQLSQGYDPPTDPSPSYKDILRGISHTDYEIPGTQGAPLGVLLIAIDPTLTEARALAARHHLEMVVLARPQKPADGDLFVEVPPDLDYRFKLLGDAFRGKMTAVYTFSGQIEGQEAELIDLTMARAVLEHAQ